MENEYPKVKQSSSGVYFILCHDNESGEYNIGPDFESEWEAWLWIHNNPEQLAYPEHMKDWDCDWDSYNE